MPTVAAAGSLCSSVAAVKIHFPSVGGKVTATHSYSTRLTIRKVSSIATQPLENRCSSSSSLYQAFFHHRDFLQPSHISAVV